MRLGRGRGIHRESARSSTQGDSGESVFIEIPSSPKAKQKNRHGGTPLRHSTMSVYSSTSAPVSRVAPYLVIRPGHSRPKHGILARSTIALYALHQGKATPSMRCPVTSARPQNLAELQDSLRQAQECGCTAPRSPLRFFVTQIFSGNAIKRGAS